MSRFEKLTHVLWHCQYHIVWVPKYRFRVLKGPIAGEVFNCVQVYSGQLGCRVVELNVQVDHVHLLVKVPPNRVIRQSRFTRSTGSAGGAIGRPRKMKVWGAPGRSTACSA